MTVWNGHFPLTQTKKACYFPWSPNIKRKIDRWRDGWTLFSPHHATLPSEFLARFQPVAHGQTLDVREVAQVSLPFASQTDTTSDDSGKLSLTLTLAELPQLKSKGTTHLTRRRLKILHTKLNKCKKNPQTQTESALSPYSENKVILVKYGYLGIHKGLNQGWQVVPTSIFHYCCI